MAIDMEQFHQVFFEESLEGLDVMEQSLLDISASSEGASSETINTIFRAAHSIKGGSGTFGFAEVADFTHIMETLLDEARDGKRELTEELIELLLQSSDCLRHMIATLQAGGNIDNSQSQPLIDAFEVLLNNQPISTPTAAAPTEEISITTTDNSDSTNHQDILMASFDTLLTSSDDYETPPANIPPFNNDESGGDSTGTPRWRIEFIPEPQILLTGNEPLRIFRELESLGTLTTTANTSAIPEFQLLTPDECYIHWLLELEADTTQETIEEAFDWVMDECQLTVTQVNSAPSTSAESPNDETVVESSSSTTLQSQSATNITAETKVTAGAETSNKTPAPTQAVKQTPETATGGSNSSIRVGIDKVDNLINLVGELVITQSMLSELGNDFDMSKIERLGTGLEQLLQNTKELQESVMRIRMLPISFAFNRFPRMIRDLAAKTDKKVELIIHGENTELDKTVMEQIGDPLVHLVRNAIDHGIEAAEQRQQTGKTEQGCIKLDAFHQGGNIVIEVSDDGGGIDRNVIINKAIEKGLVDEATGAEMKDGEVFDLIFSPGFSTAAVVSDISGRGVGMDVVKRNIKSLGGRIQIESELGQGSTFRIHLPLTLAILDGQLVRVGSETYVIPLIAIVESLQIKPELVNHVSGNMILYRLREDNVPIIPIHQQFGIKADNTELDDALLVVVEADGNKVGLLVDDLLAQQQVVIKSLQDNYQQVAGISGATILGDGSVAMILDIAGLIDSASKRARSGRTQAA
jgi:two-component system chemotaxis sensor kinase CheA